MLKPRECSVDYKKLEELKWGYMFVSSCLTSEQDDLLQQKWEEQGGHKVVPWWQFVMENTKIELEIK